jgi:hypothetical protein
MEYMGSNERQTMNLYCNSFSQRAEAIDLTWQMNSAFEEFYFDEMKRVGLWGEEEIVDASIMFIAQ